MSALLLLTLQAIGSYMAKKVNKEIFDQLSSVRCLIIGDVMIDSYIWGEVNRISPEAPVPVFEVSKRENRLGGAANVALNVQSLGATPVLCGVIGVDAKGEILKTLMSDLDLSTNAIIEDSSRATTSKTRIISSSHHLLRVDEEDLEVIDEQLQEILLMKIQQEIEQGVDVIVFEDYDKGLLSEPLIKKVVKIAKENGIPTCVDPKKLNFNAYSGVTLFKPNFKEFTEGLKEDFSKGDFDSLKKAGKKFIKEKNIEGVLITLSEHGMMLVNDDADTHVPAIIRNIADVSGAGDTVISTAALALALGLDKERIVQLANLAGGIVCESVGVVPIEKEKLKNEYQRLY